MSTLFGYDPEYRYSSYIGRCRQLYNLNITESFIACADKQLTMLFETQTGLTINKNISISWVDPQYGNFFLVKNEVSRFSSLLWINHTTNPITITWTSRSGKIYEVTETNIDCSDILFSFENLDTMRYHQQMFPGDQLPFKLKNLNYLLIVSRLNKDCIVTLTLKEKCQISLLLSARLISILSYLILSRRKKIDRMVLYIIGDIVLKVIS